MTIGYRHKSLEQLDAVDGLQDNDALYLGRDRKPWRLLGRDLRIYPSMANWPAGEVLSGHRALRVALGQAWLCNALQAGQADSLVGIGMQAAATGEPVNVRLSGILEEPSWSWQAGPVYVGAEGRLTQDPSGLAFIQRLGWAVSPISLLLQPSVSIITA